MNLDEKYARDDRMLRHGFIAALLLHVVASAAWPSLSQFSARFSESAIETSPVITVLSESSESYLAGDPDPDAGATSRSSDNDLTAPAIRDAPANEAREPFTTPPSDPDNIASPAEPSAPQAPTPSSPPQLPREEAATPYIASAPAVSAGAAGTPSAIPALSRDGAPSGDGAPRTATTTMVSPSPGSTRPTGSEAGSEEAGGRPSGPASTSSEPTLIRDADYRRNPKPSYPERARLFEFEGKTILLVEVKADGHAGGVSVRTSSGHSLLDNAAVTAVRRWEFTPAERNGVPVAARVLVPITFRLPPSR